MFMSMKRVKVVMGIWPVAMEESDIVKAKTKKKTINEDGMSVWKTIENMLVTYTSLVCFTLFPQYDA